METLRGEAARCYVGVGQGLEKVGGRDVEFGV